MINQLIDVQHESQTYFDRSKYLWTQIDHEKMKNDNLSNEIIKINEKNDKLSNLLKWNENEKKQIEISIEFDRQANKCREDL